MTMSSIGDLAYHLMLRSRSAALSRNISNLTEQLASGRVSDPARHLGGDVSHLLDIGRDLKRMDGFDQAVSETRLKAETMQSSLEMVRSASEDLGHVLTDTSNGALEPARDAIIQKARDALSGVLAALNTSSGGRSLFGGVATDRAPLGSVDTLLQSLSAVSAVETSPAARGAAIDAWFDDPAGFTTTFYSGADRDLSPVQVGERNSVELAIRADDPVVKDVLKGLASVVLAAEEPSPDAQVAVHKAAGQVLLQAAGELTGLQARLGQTQARLDETATWNAAARSSLETARSGMLEADPYETALQLEKAQFQLESLYALTARNSRLSLLSFIE